MNNIASLFTFDYDRETQLWPALLLMLAPLISLNLLGLNVNNVVGATAGGISLGAVITVTVAKLIHNTGKAFARRYFKGYPTTVTCLRLREQGGYTVEQRRAKLEAVTGVQLLTKRQETAKPAEADERLNHAINMARDKMRDQKLFPLLWRELKSYGYWRNMCALKWWGIGLASISILVPAVVMVIAPHEHTLQRSAAMLSGAAFLLFWVFGVGQKKFEAASERYTDQFFNGLFRL